MKKKNKPNQIDVHATLALMPAWVKEKAKRYHANKKFAEKIFGRIVKLIQS